MSIYATFQLILDAVLKSQQEIVVENLPAGRILDIGGGGEGVIAQIGGSNVIAIDKYASEINEAKGKSPDSSWMVADGTFLPFESFSIDHATAFFSLMYMPEDILPRVFTETQRVLKQNGEFWVWDVNMPSKKKLFAIRIQVLLPLGKRIKTVYGVKTKKYTAEKICQHLTSIGFNTEVITSQKYWYLIRATKN